MDAGYARSVHFEGPDSMTFQGDFSEAIDPEITRLGAGNSTGLLSQKMPELFVASADASRVVQIGMRQTLWCNQFSWSPDSTYIVGICGSGFYNRPGSARSLSADSIFLLNVAKPNSKPRIIAHNGVENVNSTSTVSQ
jgi:hypothetical protein